MSHEATAGLVLALGGGGARGLAHIGVLRGLEQARIPIAAIAGTSIGAIVGGIYAAGGEARGDSRQLARLLATAPRSPLPNVRPERGVGTWLDTAAYLRHDVFGLGRHDGKALEAAIEAWVGVRRIESLELPFRAVATDIRSGRAVWLDSGRLAAAVHASAAMPGVFRPVRLEGRSLMDGGVVENVPVAAARHFHGSAVLAVSVSPNLDPRLPRTGLGLLARAEQIRAGSLEATELARADVALQVPMPASVGLFDFDRARELIALGREALNARLPELRTALARQPGS